MRAFLICLALVITGCTSLIRPEGFGQQAAYAQGAVTATRQACADLLERGRMGAQDGRTCLTLTDEAAMLLGAVSQAGEASTAYPALERTYAILRQLELLLQENNK